MLTNSTVGTLGNVQYTRLPVNTNIITILIHFVVDITVKCDKHVLVENHVRHTNMLGQRMVAQRHSFSTSSSGGIILSSHNGLLSHPVISFWERIQPGQDDAADGR